ncbi:MULTISPECIES: hypothetical protein [Aeromicrobium]|uniref:hypothetical protein n=1 Tax=Aeromicrobium TaxID=2040 RepID=UPI0006FF363D|nr:MULTISPECIES: hypothetical protein [Aeromicrobium]KQX75022.1 hypothetical protein ASD10_07390 [Aeromicrobium sp. Root472D3]MBD8605303.1 hypothetical protein [Aeromicrobium sp. CFBP 8757]MCL8250907.1 hypothetical protein [Aeromicrobium fastidiosum]
MNGIRTVRAPGGWKLVIPAGWATLSTDPNVRNDQIKRLLDRQFEGTARDELIQVRVEADRRLKQDLARAAENGVTQMHALVDPIVKLPISATLLVAQLYVGSDREVVDGLAKLLGKAEGVLEVENLTLGGVPATRRRRRALEPSGEEPDAPEIWHTHVDYMIQISMDDLLVLSFVTSTDALSDQLTFVFDSIAATLHQGDSGLEWEPTFYAPNEAE